MGLMNRVLIQLVALLCAAPLAGSALGQTGDQAACDGSSAEVRLSNRENVVLNQNSPNPFVHETTITYRLPDGVKRPKLSFTC
jgi:hypothetical protein